MVFLHVVMLSATMAPVLIGAAQSQKANYYLPISTWHYIVTSGLYNYFSFFFQLFLFSIDLPAARQPVCVRDVSPCEAPL